MHIVTGSCVLLVWMCTLASVKSQGCTKTHFVKSKLYDSNFDVSDLDERYPAGKQLRVNCQTGYRGFYRILCIQGVWQARGTKCEPLNCPKAEVANGFVVGPYSNKLYYSCNEGYKLLSGWWGEATCSENGWVGLGQCIAKTDCSLPVVPNGKVTPQKTHYKDNESIRINCDEEHRVELLATCTRGTWNQNLKESCRRADRYCTSPPKVEHAVGYAPSRKQYLSGSEVTYQCHHGWNVKGDGTIRCQNGVWEKKNVTCKQLRGCETPPHLPDGDVRYTMKDEYNHSEKVEYMCQTLHIMEGDPYRTCEDGEWTGHMRCLRPCILNDDDIRRHNIAVKSSYNKFLLHDDAIEFMCSKGNPMGSLAMRQRCNSGELSLPSCS